MRPDTILSILCVLAVLVLTVNPVAGGLLLLALAAGMVWWGTFKA